MGEDIKTYGSSREYINKLMEEMGYDPYQAEIIGMDRFGIRLLTKNVSPTGMTLVCVQDGTETTGQLQTGEKYKLVVQKGDTWENVDYATDAIGWEDIALLIPNDGEVEWDIDWTRLYGELPAGKYCIVKEINDFRAAGDYDTQVYSVAFEIGNDTIDVCIDGVTYFGIGLPLVVEPDESAIEYVEIPAGHGDVVISAFARMEEGKMIACLINGEWYRFHSMEALASSQLYLEP